MKAITYSQYGTPAVLQYTDVEKPIPTDDQVLVKIHAASINYADWIMLTADPFLIRPMTGGWRKPKYRILGADIAGRVAAVGKNVTDFQPGDAVFGNVSENGMGGFAEYVATSPEVLAIKPDTVSFADAAAIPLAAGTALHGLRHGDIQAGQQVLINGASGGVGTYAIQLAKHFGAEVTAVCSSRKADIARAAGADHVIDYTKEDFTQNGHQYDFILAANGDRPLRDYRRSLRKGGRYVVLGGTMSQIFQGVLLGPLQSLFSGKTLGGTTFVSNREAMEDLMALLEMGAIRSMIDRRYPLSDMPDAMRYFGDGQTRGKLVIDVYNAGDK